MPTMAFYEKPGCINGEKQKQILRNAGHDLDCTNILTKYTYLSMDQGKTAFIC